MVFNSTGRREQMEGDHPEGHWYALVLSASGNAFHPSLLCRLAKHSYVIFKTMGM